MNIKKLFSGILTGALLLSSTSAFAMSTSDFDNGISKGISYFNRGLYYEARDEFQWFADYNWGKLNDGQQKYLLDYLGSANQKVRQWENDYVINTDLTELLNMTCGDITRKYGNLYSYSGFEGGMLYKHGNCPYVFCYGGYGTLGDHYPNKLSKCELVSAKLSDLIPNTKWSYTKSELESLFGVSLAGQPWYMPYDSTVGYTFAYKGMTISIYTYDFDGNIVYNNGKTTPIWDGTVYADYDIEISHYEGEYLGHLG